MKLLTIVSDWPSPWTKQSSETHAMCQSQIKLGHDVALFAGRKLGAGETVLPEGAQFVNFLDFPIKPLSYFFTSTSMLFYYLFWRRKNNPEVIHVHTDLGYLIILYRRLLKNIKPEAQELQSSVVYYASESATSPSKIQKLLVTEADKVIFATALVRDAFLSLFHIDKEKSMVQEKGIDTDLFVPVNNIEKSSTKKDFGIDYEEKVITYNGALGQKSHFLTALQILSKLPVSYRLLLVGTFESADSEFEFMATADELGLKERLVLAGEVSYDQLPIIYQASDLVMVLDNQLGEESLPQSVLYGLACAVPVVFYAPPQPTPARQQSIAGLCYIDHIDPTQIASQILDIIHREVQVDRPLVVDHFSWDKKICLDL